MSAAADVTLRLVLRGANEVAAAWMVPTSDRDTVALPAKKHVALEVGQVVAFHFVEYDRARNVATRKVSAELSLTMPPQFTFTQIAQQRSTLLHFVLVEDGTQTQSSSAFGAP
jgi:hypothetical protein